MALPLSHQCYDSWSFDRAHVCVCVYVYLCVCVGVLEIHWQKTNTHMQIGSALKTNVLCIDIALFLTPSSLPLPLPWPFTMPAVDCNWSGPTPSHTHTYTHKLWSEYNINIQFKLLPNWLSQISIMHLLYSLHSRLKAADVANFHTYTHAYIVYMASSISNLICQSFLFCPQSTNPSSASLDLAASHN